MKRLAHRNRYQTESPYAQLVQSLPRVMVDRIAARLAAGEHEEDVARDENLVPGAVRYIQQSVKVIGDTPLEPERLHRIRVLLCSETPQRVAAMENLPIEVVEKIARRMEVHASRRERRMQDTVGNNGG